MKKYKGKIGIRFKAACMTIILAFQLFFGLGYFYIDASASEIIGNLDNIYVSEENYEEDMKNIVEPYLENNLEYGYINGKEGINLYYEKYKVKDAKANIVISHGYTENLERYNEIIYYFLKNGYNVFGIEHRGHGRSGNLGIADKSQINVEDFGDYIDDFKKFMDEIVMFNNDAKKVFLFAHSMGGAIGVKFLEDYPEYFSGAVLSSPMLQVHTGKIPSFLANIVVKSAVTFGKGGDYVLGKTPYIEDYNVDEIGTSSINRYMYSEHIVVANEEFQKGGASYNWTNEAFKVTKEITKYDNASKVEIPVLLFQAEDDTYVKPDGQNKFAKGAKNCEVKLIKNARHELYRERDEIQKAYLEDLLCFYNKEL